MARFQKSAGNFELELWTDGHPASIEIVHTEPNGSEARFRMLGTEDLYDLLYAVQRAIAYLEIDKHGR